MYGTPGGEIPSVGKVELAWIQAPLPPVIIPSKTAPKVDSAEDPAMDEGDAMARTSSPAQAGHGQEQQENLDYDVADDNEWGVQ